jgi:hypothetical protein
MRLRSALRCHLLRSLEKAITVSQAAIAWPRTARVRAQSACIYAFQPTALH